MRLPLTRCFMAATTTALGLLLTSSAGAQEPPSYAPPAPPADASTWTAPPNPTEATPEDNSPAMKYSGIALTATGLAGLGIGNALFFQLSSQSGDFSTLGAMVIGGPIILTSSALVCVGIPLWAVGASDAKKPERREAQASLAPEVQIGVGNASATWSF